ncbi:acid phosphatase [Nocardia lijiangensis]|uniref:acid phosphatase n=1 Tax=Nocardia lijiangensis TaxID=299618 RepID=UPI001FE167B4|nr:acid phosphatase [Nocardia lijiangensis]
MSAHNDARLVLLRHGETSWSRERRHTSHTDLPLTEHGERQAEAAGRVIDELKLRDPLVLTSPRQRAVRTAALAGFAESTVENDLVEWDYGDYEGLTTTEIRETTPGWTIWTGATPGGETPAQVRARADRVLGAAESALPERDVVLVGHGHFSRVLIARWAEFEVVEGRRFAMTTAAVSLLGYEHDERTIHAHNIVSTIEGAK